jgi:hypothetical protein
MRTISEITADLKIAGQKQDFFNGINEGGDGFNPHTITLDKLHKELAAAKAVVAKEAQLAEWTREVTEVRRASWNTEVKALGAKKGGTLDLADLLPIQKKLGFTMGDLKEAIARHGL